MGWEEEGKDKLEREKGEGKWEEKWEEKWECELWCECFVVTFLGLGLDQVKIEPNPISGPIFPKAHFWHSVFVEKVYFHVLNKKSPSIFKNF